MIGQGKHSCEVRLYSIYGWKGHSNVLPHNLETNLHRPLIKGHEVPDKNANLVEERNASEKK